MSSQRTILGYLSTNSNRTQPRTPQSDKKRSAEDAELDEPPVSNKKLAQSTATTITARIKALLRALPNSHPIFGPAAQKLVRLPLTSPRSNGQSWDHWAKKLGESVEKVMGPVFKEGHCWMTKQTVMDISRPNGPHSSEIYRKISNVRLLAFLANPSNTNWKFLISTKDDPPGERPIDSPFSHNCNNGSITAGTAGCINGLDHGRFASRQENESHKECHNGARALCPGHREPKTFCYFVHNDGEPKPCRNSLQGVPVCSCERKCYP